MTPNKTPLYDQHVAAGAKMIPFAGFEMPVRYSSLIEEHMAVRNDVGIFDVSHMGQFMIEGAGATELIRRISSNDIDVIIVGQAQYSCMPNDKGGIVDDLIIYKLDDSQYLLVVNASNIEKDWEWITSQNTVGASMKNLSGDYALLAVQGPKAHDLVQPLTSVDLSEIQYYHFTVGNIKDINDVIISATGYTGSGGFELYVPSPKAVRLWNLLFDQENEIAASPAGLGARDTLRLEMGYCLYGNDIDDTTSPIEAGLGWITKFNHPFVNAANLEKQKLEGPKRRLCGILMEEKGIPRQGYEILSVSGERIGNITSGTMSPMLDIGIGLGYIDVPYHKKGTEVLIQIRKKQLQAKVVRPPFVEVKK